MSRAKIYNTEITQNPAKNHPYQLELFLVQESWKVSPRWLCQAAKSDGKTESLLPKSGPHFCSSKNPLESQETGFLLQLPTLNTGTIYYISLMRGPSQAH